MSSALGTIPTPFGNVPIGQIPPRMPYIPTPSFIGQQFAYNITSNTTFATTSTPTPQPVNPNPYYSQQNVGTGDAHSQLSQGSTRSKIVIVPDGKG